MLPKNNRLIKDTDFKLLAKKGKPFYSKDLGLKVLQLNNKPFLVGIVVSTKVSKKAVERNRLKRRISEILRLWLGRLKDGYGVMILTRPGLLGKKTPEIEAELDLLFKKARLFKSS